MKCQFYFLSFVDAILVVWRCIQRNFYEPMLSEIFVAKWDTASYFLKNTSLNSYSSLLFVIEAVFISNKLQSAELEQHFGKFHNHTVWFEKLAK